MDDQFRNRPFICSAPRELKTDFVKIVVQNPTKSDSGTKGFLTGNFSVGC